MNLIKSLFQKYQTFIKYIVSAGISFALDLAIFTIINLILKRTIAAYSIIIATITAKIISSIVNYHMNRNRVFNQSKDGKKRDSKSFIQFALLVVIQTLVSSFSVFTIFNLTHYNETLIKIPVDCVLFIVNYFVQKIFIFSNKDTKIKKQVLPEPIKRALPIVLAIITSFVLVTKLDTKRGLYFSKHDTDTFLYLVVGIALYFFYKRNLFKNKKRISFIILSCIFSLLLIFGYSFDLVDSAKLVYGNGSLIGFSILKFIGLFAMIYTSLNMLYDFLSKSNIKDSKRRNKLIELFDKHTFLFVVITLVIFFLPYWIAYYPGTLGYDPANQIKEVMGIHNRYMDSVVLLNPDVTITNFNPVIHTLLLGNCFKLGVNIGNVNLGIFLYTMIQSVLMISCLAYSIVFLKKEGVPRKFLLVILAIYALVPIFPFYSLSTNKDTFFTLAIMLYIIELYKTLKYDRSIKGTIPLVLVGTWLFLSRNNGIYTILLSLPFFLLLKDRRKVTIFALFSIVCLYLGYSKVLLPACNITETSIREALSIPFQHTAALVVNDEEVIEEEDRKTIAKILDYDKIKTSYNPEKADPVKNTFNRYYEEKDLSNYFKVWGKYLVKRPLIYIDATINNVYGYFYPNTSKWYFYYSYNTKLKEAGFDYHYNSLDGLRDFLSSYGTAFQNTPVVGAFVNIGLNVWVYLFLVCALIVNRNKKWILILTPALSLILVCMASPANTYFRYALPYVATLPMVLGFLYQNKKSSN